MATAQIENLSADRRTRSIFVNDSERACINCAYYEQYFRRNRSNVCVWVATSEGYCVLNRCKRGALRQPCKEFEEVE